MLTNPKNDKASEGFGRSYIHGDQFYKTIPERDGQFIKGFANAIPQTTTENQELLKETKKTWIGQG